VRQFVAPPRLRLARARVAVPVRWSGSNTPSGIPIHWFRHSGCWPLL